MNNTIGRRPKPFTCYFCNKTIENETQQGHISTCGSYLEPCVWKCGSYIPRNMKMKHQNECANKTKNFSYPCNNSQQPQNISRSNIENRKEKRYSMDASNLFNSNHQEDLNQVKSKLEKLEQFCKNLHQNFSHMKNSTQETLQTQQNMQMQTRLEIDKVLYQNQLLIEWRRLIESQIENLKEEMRPLEKIKREVDSELDRLTAKVNSSETLRSELNAQKEAFLKEQISNRETRSDFKTKIEEMRDFFTQENAVVAAIWNDQKTEIGIVCDKVNEIQTGLEELKAKCTGLIFDLKTASQISSDASERLELRERETNEMKNSLSQLKLDVEILEENVFIGSGYSPGRLLWKLSGFNTKLEKAKENNVVLKSPIFYSHEYGYKLRLLIYLNGIKKWRGRNLIACIHVLNGEYDVLLKWPCNIEGSVILRDLQNISNPKDYSKFITAKRNSGDEENEDPQESSTQYIFIPHSVLLKSNYVKDDTLFIEVKIKHVKNKHEETTL